MFAIGRNLVRSMAVLPIRSCRQASQKGNDYEGSGGQHILPSGNPNYEGDGKTTASVINTELEDDYLMIQSYTAAGFRLNNGVYCVGPIALFPKSVLQWNIESIEKVTPEAFCLFELIEPKVDVLVIGSGEKKVPLNNDCFQYLKKLKTLVELLPTPEAIPIFNFLNAERRNVVGLFVPPADIMRDSDSITNKIHTHLARGTLFRRTFDIEKLEVKALKEMDRREKAEEEAEKRKQFLKQLKEGIIKDAEDAVKSSEHETPKLSSKDKDRDK